MEYCGEEVNFFRISFKRKDDLIEFMRFLVDAFIVPMNCTINCIVDEDPVNEGLISHIGFFRIKDSDKIDEWLERKGRKEKLSGG